MGCVVFCSFLCIEVCVAESNVFVIFTLVVDDFVDDFVAGLAAKGQLGLRQS